MYVDDRALIHSTYGAVLPHVIELSRVQHLIFSDPARFRFIVSGRRVGKTYEMLVECVYEASRGAQRLAWYVAPTYRMARDIAWDLLLTLIPPQFVARTNETRLTVVLTNGSIIALKGADDPDSLRGRGLHFVAFDEWAMMDRRVWHVVTRPMLGTTRGRAIFGTTPLGHNHAYDDYVAITSGQRVGWKAWMFTTLEGGRVPADEVAAARAELDPRIFRQEYESSFETLQGRIYDNFEPSLHVRDDLVDVGGELLVGMDFNVNPMTCVIGVRAADELHVLDALELPVSNTDEVAAELKTRYPDRTIIVCPDPSGRQRRTSAGGRTDFTILERAGFIVDAPSAAPFVKDRINAVQTLLKNADGRARLYVHPRATALVKGLRGHVYKELTSLPDKTQGFDHINDALGYLVWRRFNLLTNTARTVRVVA